MIHALKIFIGGIGGVANLGDVVTGTVNMVVVAIVVNVRGFAPSASPSKYHLALLAGCYASLIFSSGSCCVSNYRGPWGSTFCRPLSRRRHRLSSSSPFSASPTSCAPNPNKPTI